jgi:hypothetical protein
MHSERPAWIQVVRAVAFFCLTAIFVVGSLTAAAWSKDAWDRHQVDRAQHAAMAALGLRRICEGNMVASCVQRAADAVNVPVVSAPSSYGDLLVSIARSKIGPVGFAPVPVRATEVRYAAFERVFSQSDAVLGYNLVTRPSSRPGRGHVHTGSAEVDGVQVDLLVARAGLCGCERLGQDVWAEWHHQGELYAVWFLIGSDQGPPAKFLKTLMPTLRYTPPARQS